MYYKITSLPRYVFTVLGLIKIDLIEVLGLVGLAWFGLDFKCLGGAFGTVCGFAHLHYVV
jgi:hypothetical protein